MYRHHHFHISRSHFLTFHHSSYYVGVSYKKKKKPLKNREKLYTHLFE